MSEMAETHPIPLLWNNFDAQAMTTYVILDFI